MANGTLYSVGFVVGETKVSGKEFWSNWTQNDTFRASGDAAYGTVLEIVFMYAMALPCVCLSGLVWNVPFVVLFICCYIDEPIRFILMQRHLYSGKWTRPVTPQGKAAHEQFMAELRSGR